MAAGRLGRYIVNRLEQRYRTVLRLLPASYRDSWAELAIVRAVTVIMGTVVGLTFLFGFGNTNRSRRGRAT